MGENEGGDMGEGEAEDEVTQPKAKGKGKKKATMGQFTRDEGKLVDEAYAQIVLLLATEDFCPLNDAYDEMIARGWIAAIKARKLSLDDWPLGADHEEVIRGRIHSLRGRIRDRVLDAVISVFGLSLDTMDSVEEIKARAGELIPDLFHRDPKIKSDTASQYQHQIISRAIYTSFFHGLKPVGLKFKDAFNPMPVETIGYMAGLIEYLLGRLKADGMYSKQLRVGISGSNVRGPAMTHLDNLDLFQECLPNLFLVQLQERTFSLVMAHITKAEQRRQSRSAASRLTAQDFDRADELSPAQMAEMRAQFGHGSETKGRRRIVERASRAASSAMDADEVQAALDRVTPGSSRDSPVPSAHIDQDVDMPYAQETAMDEGEHEHGEDDREGSAGGEGGEGDEEGDERDEEGGEDDEEGGEGDEEGGEGGEEGDADNAGDVGDMGNVDEADVGEKDNAGEDGEQEREDKGQVNNSADDDDFSSVVLGTDGGKGDLVRDGRAFMPLGDYDSDLTEPSDGEGAKEGAKSSPKGKQGKGAKALGVGDPGSDAVGDGLEVGKDDEGGPIKSRAGGEVGSGATQAKAVGAPEDGVKPLKTSAVAPPTQASQPVESYSKPTKDNGGTGAARTSRAAKTKAAAIITEKIKGTKAKSGAAGGGSGGTGKGKQRAV
ncbi:hypothetical protein FRC08_011648 [Ceratobasidium sp. 394]|nr:hypothetical protein FRC08_011648 [Ceratobasidium sp. 394]